MPSIAQHYTDADVQTAWDALRSDDSIDYMKPAEVIRGVLDAVAPSIAAQAKSGPAAAIERVRAIHFPVDAVNYRGGTPRPARVCAGCGTDDGNWQTYPCPTVRALPDAEGAA